MDLADIAQHVAGDRVKIDALMPIGVEEYEVENTSNKVQQITLVIPRPSLANLQEKKKILRKK